MAEQFKMLASVALVLLDDANNVLLLKRTATGYRDGYYGLVAGRVDGNEPIRQAMVREAYEEANVIISPEWLTLGCVVHAYDPDRTFIESLDFYFICRQWENTIQNNEPHKHSELGFHPVDNLPALIIPSVKLGIQQALAQVPYAEYGWNKDTNPS